MRPQLASLPAIAVFTSGELPIAKACFLSDDDRIRRTTIMRLMCTLELDYAALSQELGIDFRSYFATELEQLAAADARMAQVVELRYFGGLTDSEIAEALGVTDRTVRRDWEKARLLLREVLES